MSIEEFYEAHIDKLYNFCYYRLGNRFIAEDITSEAWSKFIKLDWQKYENPVAYLYTICRNLIIDYFRSHKGEFSLESLAEKGVEIGVNPDFNKGVLVAQIFQEMDALPDEQREVLILQYVQDLNNRSIAQILGKSEAAVKSLAYRGLTTLRERMNK